MTSLSVPCPKCSPFTRSSKLVAENSARFQKHCMVSFLRGSNPNASLAFGVLLPKKQSCMLKVQAQLNDVAGKVSSNSAPVVEPTSSKEKCSDQSTIPDAASISAFMAQVKDLVKLVHSRDIMELEMKQSGCEILIRKKEALPQPPSAPVYQIQPSYAQSMAPSAPPPQAIAPATPARSASAPALPAPAKTSASSHPPLKCPMAGTFYRCSGPGEPPFVKVGDKVKKGQVICIIEAMKLMNEIEADQSGTITEILAEDAKPVSVDTPLFVIVP